MNSFEQFDKLIEFIVDRLMKIETKYNVGDEVWFGSLGFSKSATISEIKIYVMIDGYIMVEYHIEKNGYYWLRNEHEIFPTKEELLKSL